VDVRVTVDMAAAMNRLNALPRQIDRGNEQAMEDATALGLRELSIYPPQRPPRGRVPYRRTNTLARSWSREVRHMGNTIVGRVLSNGSIAPYNIYVQHHQMQASVHRGVWTNTDGAVAERIQPRVIRFFEARLQQAVGRAG
jgi:hypothetical protein